MTHYTASTVPELVTHLNRFRELSAAPFTSRVVELTRMFTLQELNAAAHLAGVHTADLSLQVVYDALELVYG